MTLDNINTNGVGDCFVVAGQIVVLSKTVDNDELALCHAIVWDENIGLHWHAWVERTQTITFDLDGGTPMTFTDCIDQSNGNDLCLPQSFYYKLGRIEAVTRYTRAEAQALVDRHHHWGPWT